MTIAEANTVGFGDVGFRSCLGLQPLQSRTLPLQPTELDASINVLIDEHPAHFGTPNAAPGTQAC